LSSGKDKGRAKQKEVLLMKRWYDWLKRLWTKLNRMAEQSQTLTIDVEVQARTPRPPF
jgi:hypothetical protein